MGITNDPLDSLLSAKQPVKSAVCGKFLRPHEWGFCGIWVNFVSWP